MTASRFTSLVAIVSFCAIAALGCSSEAESTQDDSALESKVVAGSLTVYRVHDTSVQQPDVPEGEWREAYIHFAFVGSGVINFGVDYWGDDGKDVHEAFHGIALNYRGSYSPDPNATWGVGVFGDNHLEYEFIKPDSANQPADWAKVIVWKLGPNLVREKAIRVIEGKYFQLPPSDKE
jgi:hypothetical protein